MKTSNNTSLIKKRSRPVLTSITLGLGLLTLLLWVGFCRSEEEVLRALAVMASVLCAGFTYVRLRLIHDDRKEYQEGIAAEVQFEYWKKRVEQSGEIPLVNTDLKLEPDETAVYAFKGASLLESVMTTSYLKLGSHFAMSLPDTEWCGRGRGQFVITNKRVLFVGEMVTKSIRLSNIVASKGFVHEFIISSSTDNSTLLFDIGNAFIANYLLKELR